MSIKSERGDTIIEVMVSLAVLALAFSISFATANKSLLAARNAQEHSEALQYLASQVELARIKATDPALYSTPGAFCFDTQAGATNGAIVSPVNSICTIGAIGYNVKVVDTGVQDIFMFTVDWKGVGNFATQHETIYYKIHPL